jgi:protein-tyrosine phosphatase
MRPLLQHSNTAAAGSASEPSSPPEPPETSTRRLFLLEGGCNFRDIGGYQASDGRTVRWGRIYRSGVLSHLTPRDAQRLIPLGIQTICDLRRNGERAREPTTWPAQLACLEWSEDGPNAPAIRRFAAQHPPTADGMRAAMIDLYRSLPVWMGPRLRTLFERIGQKRIPLVVHCAAGKDRTGFAIALLLLSVGVPYESVLRDYLISNTAMDYEQFILSRQTSDLGLTDAQHPLLQVPRELRRVLFSAEPEFLQAAFDELRSQYGTLDNYCRSIGVTQPLLAQVQDTLLAREPD